ncbi:hypothetical protein GCM10022222_85480 [Amycolatopsis ultiminotia]|uniref:FAD-binding domain-containing protein n=1 Tax=Amycolatopsis ultiminotia TaxID=543629 RepID=A0ABP6YRZ0_9PSEU
MSGIRVLVAGASIAGPALADWLRRRGAEVTVVERAPGLRPGGQAVDARGVAREVIRRMGLDAVVRAACTETVGAYTVDVDGNVLETFRADDDGGDGFIAEIEILRGDLSRVLHEDTRDGVEYVFGDRIAELTQDARAMAMFSFPSADFDVDYRDVAAQKRLLRERMAGFGWLTPRILAHLDDTPDFYLDQVAQVVMGRWSSGRVGLLGDAAFCSSPMSGQGTGLALVGAYLLAGELAAAGWDPEAGFAGYEGRMRSFVEANQEIGRMHARSREVPEPDAEPSPEPDMESLMELVERAINGVELPGYAGVPDSGAPAGPPITSSATP